MTMQTTRELCCAPQKQPMQAAPVFATWLGKALSGLRLGRKKRATLPIHDAAAMADIGLGTDGRDGYVSRIPKEMLRQEMIGLSLMGR